MRIKDGFELREICGEHVILSHGMDNIDFSKIISLNDEETARKDVAQVLAKWRELGLLA